MPSEAILATSGMRGLRDDTPWRRLRWTGPLALFVWALALWAMSLALTRAPAIFEKAVPIQARFIELPKPPEPAPAPPAVHHEAPRAAARPQRVQSRTMRRTPAQTSQTQAGAAASAMESTPASTETGTNLPQFNESVAPSLPGASAGKPGTNSTARFANHPGAAVRAEAVGVIPPPQDLTVGNEELPLHDGTGMGVSGWSPGGWAQDTNGEECMYSHENTGPCPGQVFTQSGRPWCHDADPYMGWDYGTCQDRFDRATAAFKRQEYAAAFAVFTQLAEKDFPPAQSNLCTIYLEGTGAPRDTQQAVHWCRKAAKEGDHKATYNLALMYSDGIGVPRDDQQAAYWFRKAAYYGYANAQYNLAVMYMHGIGVPQDDKQAVYWYRKAAFRGNALAQYNLGVMYAEGAGVPRDDKQAVYWYCKGTVRGDAKAQASLARLYGADTESAAKAELDYFCWLFSADKRSSVIAYADRHLYERKLTVEQRERAIAAAGAWKRK